MTPTVQVFPSPEELAQHTARHIVAIARSIVTRHRTFSMVLSGGSTPVPVYQLLASEYSDEMPWEHTFLFWGDERFVPADHPDSNYRMAREAMIDHVPIPESQVYRPPTGLSDVFESAGEYEQLVLSYLAGNGSEGLDVALQGVGDDGHTASLFPNDPVLETMEAGVRAVKAPPYMTSRDRITFTLPLINRSRHVILLAAGLNKREVIQRILTDPAEAKKRYPAARLDAREELSLYTDRAAYSLIDQ